MRQESRTSQTITIAENWRRRDRPPGVLSHRATMDATPLLTADDARLYRSCVGALMYHVLDRTDAVWEVSILGTYLRPPTSGAMEALRRVTRYLLAAQKRVRQAENPER